MSVANGEIMIKTVCLFCERKHLHFMDLKNDSYHIVCKKCGSYIVEHYSSKEFKNSHFAGKIHGIVSIIKEMNYKDITPIVGFDKHDDGISMVTFERMFKMIPSAIEEKADRVLLNLHVLFNKEKSILTIMKKDISFYYSESISEMEKVKKHLVENDYAVIKNHTSDILNNENYRFSFFDDISITEKGIRRIENLKTND